MKDMEQGITRNIGWQDGQGRQPTKSCSFSRQSSKLFTCNNGVVQHRYGNLKSTHPPSVLGVAFPFRIPQNQIPNSNHFTFIQLFVNYQSTYYYFFSVGPRCQKHNTKHVEQMSYKLVCNCVIAKTLLHNIIGLKVRLQIVLLETL